MNRVWWPVFLLALVLATLVGCGQPDPGPAPTLTPFGLLPTPTLPPLGRYSNCSPDDVDACPKAGDSVNLYEEFAFERATTLALNDGTQGWVLQKNDVDAVLRLLDHDVTLQAYSLPWPAEAEKLELRVEYPDGLGWPRPYIRGTSDRVWFAVDLKENAMGMSFARSGQIGDIAVQWAIPDGFAEVLFDRRVSATPTPSHGEGRSIFLDPVPGISLHHPGGKLQWGGPDDKLTSEGDFHCSAPAELRNNFGIPSLFHIRNGRSLMFQSVVSVSPSWRWTGYYFHGWQIWQADDMYELFLVHPKLDHAFRYRQVGCA